MGIEKVNTEAAVAILGPDGPLASILKGFEARTEQQAMMRNVLEAYNSNQITLIEAGTGTGKSLAYLIPAMLWAVQAKERTVISTNTITLQEQLLQKDIPLIEKALHLKTKAVLVKGMQNYVCLRKLGEALQELLLLPKNEAEELQKIEAWKDGSHDGSRSALPFSPSSTVWEKVCAENDTCNRTKCPYYSQCTFFKARREASEAQILIVNHHLLFADLVYRVENDKFNEDAILPAYNRIILDEAHNIEDIATEYFAARVSQLDILRLMARLAAEKGGKVQGKLPLLKEKIVNHYKNQLPSSINSIYHNLTIELPSMRLEIQKHAHEMFGAFSDFAQLLQSKGSADETITGESKLRLLPHHYTHPHWQSRLIPLAKQFISSLQRYSQSITALLNALKFLNNSQLEDQLKSLVFELNGLAGRLIAYSLTIEQFISTTLPKTKVRWIELQALKTLVNTSLMNAELDISKLLAEYLFSKFNTVVLCSATLTTNRHFQFIRQRLGLTVEMLPKHHIKEHIYESPFNFSQQALFAIPTDIPNPSDSSFVEAATQQILQILRSSRGNAFVLFTSYSMLKMCYERLEKQMKELRYNPMKQGDDDRQTLLKKFKSTEYSVLFGTDSFWEGVDVVGDALRCVILVKLPFRVPSDPLIQARSEFILDNGGDPFMEYSLPQAIVKFKQGFGRLIRNRNDRGCIICLDNRLMTKQYGKLFLDSLPDCQRLFVSGNVLQEKMTEFYRKTHFLTKQS